MPFELVAIVVLPEHLHCIWTLPPGDTDYPARWKKIKAAFSHRLPKGEQRSASRIAKGERGVWRYWEHTLRDERDLIRHVDYIHSRSSTGMQSVLRSGRIHLFINS